MSLVHGSLSFCPKHEFAGTAGFLTGSTNQLMLARTQSAKQPPRVQGRPYAASRELKDLQMNVGVNEAAPPVGNAFESSETQTGMKQANILEDPVAFLRNRMERKVENLKQALVAVEEAVAPSPFSPSASDDALSFVIISVFLILLFWVGNYAAPTWIFKETVFRNSKQNGDDNVDKIVRDGEPTRSDNEDVDPADLIELPPNLMPFREAAVTGFKAGRQRARDAEQKRNKKRSSRKGK